MIDRDTHDELVFLIEDTVRCFCNHNMVAGETAYKILECLAVAKQAQLQGLVE